MCNVAYHFKDNCIVNVFIHFSEEMVWYYCEHNSLRIPPLTTSVQHISIAKTLLIVQTKIERDPPLFSGKLLIKFQNILRNATQVTIWHRVNILFSVISSLLVFFILQLFAFHNQIRPIQQLYEGLSVVNIPLIIPPQRSCRGVYWYHHVHPSVSPSVIPFQRNILNNV
jgi:hypothetical protein